MTRLALEQDRGLQAERTALAWTRTALAAAASGVLVLLRDGHSMSLGHDPARLTVVLAVAVLGAGVYAIGVRRRRALLVHPRGSAPAGRSILPGVGMAVIAEGALVVTYLALPAVA